MSQTRIICEGCGNTQVFCTCEQTERHKEKLQSETKDAPASELKRIVSTTAPWIRVEDDLPCIGEKVLAYNPETELANEAYRVMEFGSVSYGFTKEITHWKELLPPNDLNS